MLARIRLATEQDAAACGAICYAAFRAISAGHAFPPDFAAPEAAEGLMRMAIPHPEIYAVVAKADGQVIGSNFL